MAAALGAVAMGGLEAGAGGVAGVGGGWPLNVSLPSAKASLL